MPVALSLFCHTPAYRLRFRPGNMACAGESGLEEVIGSAMFASTVLAVWIPFLFLVVISQVLAFGAKCTYISSSQVFLDVSIELAGVR
jgi:hypothetical protein